MYWDQWGWVDIDEGQERQKAELLAQTSNMNNVIEALRTTTLMTYNEVSFPNANSSANCTTLWSTSKNAFDLRYTSKCPIRLKHLLLCFIKYPQNSWTSTKIMIQLLTFGATYVSVVDLRWPRCLLRVETAVAPR
jgi:hypothetical protein